MSDRINVEQETEKYINKLRKANLLERKDPVKALIILKECFDFIEEYEEKLVEKYPKRKHDKNNLLKRIKRVRKLVVLKESEEKAAEILEEEIEPEPEPEIDDYDEFLKEIDELRKFAFSFIEKGAMRKGDKKYKNVIEKIEERKILENERIKNKNSIEGGI